MIENNKQIIRRLFQEVLNQRNPSLLDDFYWPNVTDHNAFPDQEAGLKGLRQSVKEILEIFSNLEVTIDDLIAENNKVCSRETWKVSEKPEEKIATGSVIHIFQLNDGKIAEEWSAGWGWLEKIIN